MKGVIEEFKIGLDLAFAVDGFVSVRLNLSAADKTASGTLWAGLNTRTT